MQTRGSLSSWLSTMWSMQLVLSLRWWHRRCCFIQPLKWRSRQWWPWTRSRRIISHCGSCAVCQRWWAWWRRLILCKIDSRFFRHLGQQWFKISFNETLRRYRSMLICLRSLCVEPKILIQTLKVYFSTYADQNLLLVPDALRSICSKDWLPIDSWISIK